MSASGSKRPEQLPFADAWSFALSHTGNRLVYVRAGEGAHIWRLALPVSGEPTEPPKKLISSTRNEFSPQYSPDGRRIVFESDRDGNHGIWVCDADGSNASALYSQAGVYAGTPRWSPDGEHVAFDCNASGNMDIWIARSNGGKAVQLTSDLFLTIMSQVGRPTGTGSTSRRSAPAGLRFGKHMQTGAKLSR